MRLRSPEPALGMAHPMQDKTLEESSIMRQMTHLSSALIQEDVARSHCTRSLRSQRLREGMLPPACRDPTECGNDFTPRRAPLAQCCIKEAQGSFVEFASRHGACLSSSLLGPSPL